MELENAGPVSVTVRATSSDPLQHTTRITLIRDVDRIEIHNEITQNFTNVPTWSFAFNVDSPELWHEEIGAVIRAKLVPEGGHYSPRNARYDWLTLNHFAALSDAAREGAGVTLSSADCAFMKFGHSTPTILDTSTPQLSVLVGGQVDGPRLGIPNQGGETRITQRFALQGRGRFEAVEAMKFALEHQNPLVTGAVHDDGDALPETAYSLLKVSNPNVLLWAFKPAEESLDRGIVVRLWNLGTETTRCQLALDRSVTKAFQTSHVETDIEPAEVVEGKLTATFQARQFLTFRLQTTSP